MFSAPSTGCISPPDIRSASGWRTHRPSCFVSASRLWSSFEAVEVASIAQSLDGAAGSFTWLREFLRQELAPYRGRASLVTRMVTASTLTMIIGVTFQIPYTAFAAIFALVLSRESLSGTAKAAGAFAVGSALGGVYVVVGAMAVLGNHI